jgi:nicotinamidase-related amidase
MNPALIVIDVQESFRKRPYWRAHELPAFLQNIQSLIDFSRGRGIPIAQVFHEELTDDAADPFSRSSGLVRAMSGLSLRPDAVFHKHVHSAMFGKTADGVTLEDWLRHRGVEELLVTGIRTEQCCETTTRHASDLGFKVRYVTDATLTFPMQSRSGHEVSTAEIRERTELVLEGRFAQVVSTATALA